MTVLPVFDHSHFTIVNKKCTYNFTQGSAPFRNVLHFGSADFFFICATDQKLKFECRPISFHGYKIWKSCKMLHEREPNKQQKKTLPCEYVFNKNAHTNSWMKMSSLWIHCLASFSMHYFHELCTKSPWLYHDFYRLCVSFCSSRNYLN